MLTVAKQFEAPRKLLGGLDAEAAATLIAATSDVALVIDSSGVIRDLAFGSKELSTEGYDKWLGQPWAETVTAESRPKVEALLQEAASKVAPRWRHVNHPSSAGEDIPVIYSAVQLGRHGAVVAVGRDLRTISALQHRLADAQQSMERDYWRLRHVETRYRLLFQMATEPVLIVELAGQKVLEANPATGDLLGENAKWVVGRTFPEGFDAASAQILQALLAGVRATGQAADARVRLADSRREFLVSASLFRQENSALFLVRFSPLPTDAVATALPGLKSKLLAQVVENAPDGFVVTDSEGRILTANPAFIDLAHLASEEQARGESLERWLGRPGVDLSVLIANLRQHGSVRLFATTLRSDYGSAAEVEISAVSVLHGEQPCFGFTIRNVERRLNADTRGGDVVLTRTAEELTGMVGRVSLKDIVRETTDQVERCCIEAALELTRDNRASAAEMLGLSRQSLYVKLRRYGLGLSDSDV